MALINVISSPWAITTDAFNTLQNVYLSHLKKEKIDIASLGLPLKNEQKRYDIFDNVGVIHINGIIAKKMNMFTEISGGASTQLIAKDLKELIADASIDAIILSIDSPGGSVDGTQELAQMVYESKKKKPIIAHSDGMIASGAYWIASAAHEIYISSGVSRVGSIGVYTKHTEVSRAEEAMGIKTTEIFSGKYKAVGSPHKQLTADDKEYMQSELDYIYSLFVNDVARNRKASVDDVLENMADGRVFTGQKAVDAGLVDGFESFDNLITLLKETGKNTLISYRR